MNEREAREILQHTKLIQVAVASMQDIKRMHRSCLAAEIPAVMDCPSTKGGWGTKLALLVQETDIPKLAQLLRDEWSESLDREGNVMPAVEDLAPNEEGELPCPACGTAAPLDDEGACTDCGLVLG